MKAQKEHFLRDIQKIYEKITQENEKLNHFYDITQGKENKDAQKVVEQFLQKLQLPNSKEAVVAILNRLVNLKEDSLILLFKKQGLSEEEIEKKLEIAYEEVSNFYLQRHQKLIDFIEQNSLLNPFYRKLIQGVHEIGKSFTSWQRKWFKHIINTINKELLQKHKNDKAVIAMLQEKGLLEYEEDGSIADRAYSVLIKEDSTYKATPYAVAFEKEVQELTQKIDTLLEALSSLEDSVFNQKQAWLNYFNAIKYALLCKDSSKLLNLWRQVDREWMAITTPLQVGHPLEYYEDKYRKAVALEWDLRIINPNFKEQSSGKNDIKKVAFELAKSFGKEALGIIEKNLLQIDRVQLYISTPALFYAAEFNGLFSAQVVPNDEIVSAELGKKIFAYIDFVRESKAKKPIMQIAIEAFGKAFILEQKDLIKNNPNLWNKIYEITTIGHEFGHILWIDSDTETLMNKSGEFKNIEEFKATTGGMMAFFNNGQKELIKHFIDDVVTRAVSLIAWQEVKEVEPYYCEGLIHLELLYKAKIIHFDRIKVTIDYENYEIMKKLYQNVYKELALHYLNKKDAALFLEQFCTKEEQIYYPKTPQLKEFVKAYYKRYQEVGNIVAAI